MTETVLFVGSNPKKASHTQPAKEMGYEIALLKSRPSSEDYNVFDHIIRADEFNIKAVLKKVRSFNKRHRIAGCLTRFEHYVPSASAIVEELGLVGPRFKSAIATRNKLLMRQLFLKHKVPSPKFMKISSLEDLKKAAQYLNYPFLLKPLSGSKSRHIQFIDSKKGLEQSFEALKKSVKCSKHGLFKSVTGCSEKADFTNKFIAENVMRGTQHTIDMLAFQGELFHVAVADLVTAQDMKIDAFYLISRTTPSVLPKKQQEEIRSVAARGVRALGIDNSGIFPELILTKSGPKVLEIAARVGGYRAEMDYLAFGVKLNRAVIEIALGKKPNLAKEFERGSTAVEVWPTKQGVIKELRNLKKVMEMKGIANFHLRKRVGEIFRLPPIGQAPVADFLTVADTPENSKRIADEALNCLQVVIK